MSRNYIILYVVLMLLGLGLYYILIVGNESILTKIILLELASTVMLCGSIALLSSMKE